MATIKGEATGKPNEKRVLLQEALENALNEAHPGAGSDIVKLKLLGVEIEQGGFVNTTRTVVTLEVLETR
jgi:hypothetical protein